MSEPIAEILGFFEQPLRFCFRLEAEFPVADELQDQVSLVTDLEAVGEVDLLVPRFPRFVKLLRFLRVDSVSEPIGASLRDNAS